MHYFTSVFRSFQAFLMLALIAFWAPSAGASWAYCQQSGQMHPAAGDCCCEVPAQDACGDCCGGEDAGGHKPDCCVDGGKMLPEGLVPAIDGLGPIVVCVLAPAADMPGADELRPRVADSRVCLMRAPPPRRAIYLVCRSLRL